MMAPHVMPVKGQSPPAEGGNQTDRQSLGPRCHCRAGAPRPTCDYKIFAENTFPISSSPSLGEREEDSAAISFQGSGICGADGEMLETEESQLRNPAEHVPHLTLSVSTCRTLLIYHRLLQGIAINLESSIQDPPQIQLFPARVRGAMPLQ